MSAAAPTIEVADAQSPKVHRYMDENTPSPYYAELLRYDQPLERLAALARDVAEKEDLAKALGIAVADNPWVNEDPRGPILDERIRDIADMENFPEQFLLDVMGTEGLIEAAKRLGFAREYRRSLSRNNPIELARAIAEVLGFAPLRPLYGLISMIEQVAVREKRLAAELQREKPDIDIVHGCIVTVFRLLERACRELLEFYLQWRFGGDEGQFHIWLTDKKLLRMWQRGEVTLGTYRAILVNIEQVLQSQPGETQRLNEVFARSYLINPPGGLKLQPLLKLPDVTQDHLAEIKISIERRNSVIHWTEQGSERQADLLEAIDTVGYFLNYLATERIFPEVVTVLERGVHHRAGARVRLRKEREEVLVPCDEPLELHPTQYYFIQAKRYIFIKRKPQFTQGEPD
jgi:hypothetical protein